MPEPASRAVDADSATATSVRASRRVVLRWPAALAALAAAGCTQPESTGTPLTPVGAPSDTVARPGTSQGMNATVAGITGKLLYVGDSDIWMWERGNPRRLTQDRVSRQPAWSPDGKHIAHIKLDPSSSELWVMDADSSNSRQLTQNYSAAVARSNWVFRPVWWPDGSRLLFLSEETTYDLMLWQIGADGRNRRPFLSVADLEGGVDMPSISPDTRRVAAVTYRGAGSRSQVWTYTLPNGPWRQLTETADGAYDPVWSPDGSRIAYTGRVKGQHDIWVINADGSGEVQITRQGSCRAPCWSPNGQTVAFLAADGSYFDLSSVPAPPPGAGVRPAAAGTATLGSTTGGTPPATVTVPEIRPATPLQLTRGARIDATSGISWTK